MKFVPRYNHINGRTAIKKSDSVIIRLDETAEITKFVFVDAVGVGAAAAGIKIGDVLLATRVNGIVFDEGRRRRALLEEKDVACFLTDIAAGELFVQTENGKQFVPFDAPEAAEPMGAQEPSVESKAAE